jgi:hypothetical protein
MKDLADAHHVVAHLAKELSQGRDLGQVLAEMGGVFINLGNVRPAPGHERRPAGVAQGILAVRLGEPHPGLGQLVQVGRLDQRMAITTQGDVEVVGNDKKDIQFLAFFRGVGLTRRRNKEKNHKTAGYQRLHGRLAQ